MNVLVVDDDPTTRYILEQILVQRGHTVLAHDRAETAWEACRENLPPIVILDWLLPGMDGLELCRRIRELPRGDRSVILIITVRNQPGDLKQVLDAGADDYLAKPFDHGLLAVRLEVAERLVEILELRKQAEEALIDVNRVLAQRNTLLLEANKELEAFSYSVSHDLRIQLRHINSFAELLGRKSATLDQEGRRYLAIVAEASRQMGQMIDSLLTFSRLGRQGMALSPVDLGQLVTSVLEPIQASTPADRIVWTVHPLPVVTADPTLLRHVVLNLVSNAVKYSAMREPARIEIGLQSESPDEIVVFVKDNGVGFDMQYADKLFGVFQRLHGEGEFEGIGIGLANARRIVARHGGRTWAEGVEGQGATFYFSLPRQLDGGHATGPAGPPSA